MTSGSPVATAAPKELGRIDPSKLSGREQTWKTTRAHGTLVGHYESELKALEELEHDFEQRKEQHALILKERKRDFKYLLVGRREEHEDAHVYRHDEDLTIPWDLL